MHSNFWEKRNFHRMAVDCRCSYREAGSEIEHPGIVKNLSGDGILIWVSDAVADGTGIEVTIDVPGGLSDTFVAVAEVIRSRPAEDPAYIELACQMIPLK